jgi:hypothetical protein
MKKLFSISILCITLLIPATVSALIQPFGGKVVTSVSCSCSYGKAIFFAPMYPAPNPFPYAGALQFIPRVSILHPYFKIGTPKTWHLGQYLPGVQSCLIGEPPSCVPLPTAGTIVRVGTSDL